MLTKIDGKIQSFLDKFSIISDFLNQGKKYMEDRNKISVKELIIRFRRFSEYFENFNFYTTLAYPNYNGMRKIRIIPTSVGNSIIRFYSVDQNEYKIAILSGLLKQKDDNAFSGFQYIINNSIKFMNIDEIRNKDRLIKEIDIKAGFISLFLLEMVSKISDDYNNITGNLFDDPRNVLVKSLNDLSVQFLADK
ncbi:MAG: hypothetical protein GY870_02590 [archaeon]|nr:hypothetical protein [archaeon]